MELSELIDGQQDLVAMNSQALAPEYLAKNVALVTIDSRKVVAGAVFVACKGATAQSHDGHRHIEQAISQGAIAIIVQEIDSLLVDMDCPVFLAKNTRIAAAQLAERFYGYPSKQLKLVGVTGTNGKTTVTFLLQTILKVAGHQAAVFGTIGIGEPASLQKTAFTTPEAETLSEYLADLCAEGFTHVCMEVSSHALATHRVDGLHFVAGGFTNLSVDHLDFHGTLDAYQKAKDRFFEELLPKSVFRVLPVEHHLVDKSEHVITWGYSCEATVSATNVVFAAEHTQFQLKIGDQQHFVKSPLVGDFNVDNILCAAGLAHALDIDFADIVKGLEAAQGPAGRLQRVASQPGEPTVFVDFAHTPDGLKRLLKTLRLVTRGRLIVVFGCGGDRDRTKRPMMGKIAGDLADVIVITDDNPRSEEPKAIHKAILAGVENDTCDVRIIGEREDAIQYAILSANSDDVVVIAGRGHEKVQDFGSYSRPFDDVLVAKMVLEMNI